MCENLNSFGTVPAQAVSVQCIAYHAEGDESIIRSPGVSYQEYEIDCEEQDNRYAVFGCHGEVIIL